MSEQAEKIVNNILDKSPNKPNGKALVEDGIETIIGKKK